jgi:hypothetical protein
MVVIGLPLAHAQQQDGQIIPPALASMPCQGSGRTRWWFKVHGGFSIGIQHDAPSFARSDPPAVAEP